MTHDEQAREIIRAFNVDHAGNRVANVTDLLEQIVGKAIEEAVAAERERCAGIVQLAREGRLDTDFRTIIHNIRGDWSLEESRSGNGLAF